jgi:hypothetical protein
MSTCMGKQIVWDAVTFLQHGENCNTDMHADEERVAGGKEDDGKWLYVREYRRCQSREQERPS